MLNGILTNNGFKIISCTTASVGPKFKFLNPNWCFWYWNLINFGISIRQSVILYFTTIRYPHGYAIYNWELIVAIQCWWHFSHLNYAHLGGVFGRSTRLTRHNYLNIFLKETHFVGTVGPLLMLNLGIRMISVFQIKGYQKTVYLRISVYWKWVYIEIIGMISKWSICKIRVWGGNVQRGLTVSSHFWW